jgi:NADH-quinone oxidoreductase subunit N
MTRFDLLILSPLLIIAIAPIIIMLGVTISRNFRLAYIFSLFMFILAFASLMFIAPLIPHNISSLLEMDRFGMLFLGIIYLTAIFVTIISYEYLKLQYGQREEYFIILFVAVLGASIVVLSSHFISFFLGLEALSISLYVMIAYLKWRSQCIEASIKFLIVASVATALLLFGMGMIYFESGSMSFKNVFPGQADHALLSPMLLAGAGMIMAGIGFKLALVPFHMWTPDVYQGSPLPVTAFIATISKGALLALALRLFTDTASISSSTIVAVLTIISIASMLTGNFLALRQTSLKRLLAYSSIAHFGYLIVTVISGSGAGIEAAAFYMIAYLFASLGAFGTLSALSVCEHDADNIEALRGLYRNNPLAALTMTLSMLSLAGLPLTAGFIAKFFVVLAGAGSDLWLLVFSLVLTSLISFYYYFRVIVIMFGTPESTRRFRIPVMLSIILFIISATIVFMGLVPSAFTELISHFSSIKLNSL